MEMAKKKLALESVGVWVLISQVRGTVFNLQMRKRTGAKCGQLLIYAYVMGYVGVENEG